MAHLFELFWIFICISICLATNFTKEVFKPPPSVNESIHLDVPYCFRLTWVGSRFYTKSQIRNLTCEDLLQGGKDIPCRKPLVATKNGHLPDTDYIWEQFKKTNPNEIACRMTGGDVCVKYTYVYNQAVENITYMCAKVRIDDEGAIRQGCYSQYRNGREIEVCACESEIGGVPCNKGNAFHFVSSVIIGFLLILLSAILTKIM